MVTVPLHTGARPRPAPRRSGSRGLLAVLLLLVGGGVLGAWAWWNGTIGPVAVREHCTATAAGSTAQVNPVQGGNAAVIAAIAVRRGLPARAATIGIATAVQESKLTNIDYGDRDSLGLFQQRPSQGWGTRAEILDPVYSTNAFYDALVKVDGYEQMVITEVAQKVQRSAYPSAYADHEPEGRVLASTLSGYSPGGFNCVLRPVDELPAESAGSGGLTPRAAAVAEAAAAETGRREVSPVGDSGRVARYEVGGEDAVRLAWSLAGWAVARADGLQVVAVEVADRRWDRESSVDGWTGRSGEPLPAGEVVVTVA